MPDPVTGVLGGTALVGGVIQSKSASKAAKAQQQANAAGIAEERRQFDEMRRLLQPYTQAGPVALQEMMALIGLPTGTAPAPTGYQTLPAGMGGPTGMGTPGFNPMAGGFYDPQRGFVFNGSPTNAQMTGYAPTATTPQGTTMSRQQQAIMAQEQNPLFQALARQGEEAILQNASATGGLRGGNTQGALARFRPALLNQFIEQQYGRLAGITSLGQQSAAGVGTAGMQVGSNIADRLAATGAARAAGIGAQGQIFSDTLGLFGGLAAGALGGGGSGARGGF